MRESVTRQQNSCSLTATASTSGYSLSLLLSLPTKKHSNRLEIQDSCCTLSLRVSPTAERPLRHSPAPYAGTVCACAQCKWGCVWCRFCYYRFSWSRRRSDKPCLNSLPVIVTKLPPVKNGSSVTSFRINEGKAESPTPAFFSVSTSAIIKP
jgi:hypothetical protein